jgi:protein phosphatase
MPDRFLSGASANVKWAAGSCTGGCRDVNEDAFGVDGERLLFVVADGCGGQTSGQLAADVAIRHLLDRDGNEEGRHVSPHGERLACAVSSANEAIFRAWQPDPPRLSMGCTLAALRLDGGRATIVHVGDCRVGRLTTAFKRAVEDEERRELSWLTMDHTLWTEAQRCGFPEDVVKQLRADHGSVVTRAVGVAEVVDVDVQYRHLKDGEIFVLCTDGVTALVERQAIADIVRARTRPLAGRCKSLLDAAEAAGGHDNATVILVEASA